MSPVTSDAGAWTPRSVQVGEWKITALSDGFFRLDGGSMWGVVPANLWRKLTPPAEDNTIRLALRPFLLERGDVKAVVEVGVGDRWEEKWRGIYHIDRSQTLEDAVTACGLAPDEVTHVIASHCHWDHIGSQVVERDGALAPLFPNARHFAPAVEVEMLKSQDHIRRASYRLDDLLPIEEAGLLETFTGETELLPGVKAHELGGHSDGVSVITVNEDGEGDTAIFWADVVPTTHHIQPAFIMAYDIDVVRSFEVRTEWMKRAAEGSWVGLFYHDPEHAFGRLSFDGKRFTCEAMVGAEVRDSK